MVVLTSTQGAEVQKGDLMKCEELAREALRIRDQLPDPIDRNIGRSCDLLARVLQTQSNLGDETKKLFERSLSIFVRVEGDRGNTAAAYNGLGQFYYVLAGTQPVVEIKRKQLLLAKSHFEEACRIQSMIEVQSPNHPNSLVSLSRLSEVFKELSRI
jgi:hypothetical protein